MLKLIFFNRFLKNKLFMYLFSCKSIYIVWDLKDIFKLLKFNVLV
jgi:hypothetical protein